MNNANTIKNTMNNPNYYYWWIKIRELARIYQLTESPARRRRQRQDSDDSLLRVYDKRLQLWTEWMNAPSHHTNRSSCVWRAYSAPGSVDDSVT